MRGKYGGSEWIGKKYHRLTVIDPVHVVLKNGKQQWFWRLRCDCGNETLMMPKEVIKGKNKSCGCYRKTKTTTTHGESHTHLHNIWCGMNNRCDPSHTSSDGYGKRGIRVCEEWGDYMVFAEWARKNGYQEGLSIERIDVDGDYCPENCTWILPAKQARNRRTTKWVEWNGRKMSLAEATEISGLPYKQVHYRLKKGWTLEKALTTPIKGPSEFRRKCEKHGIDYHIAYNRIHVYGWTEDDALNIPVAGKGANQVTYNRKR